MHALKQVFVLHPPLADETTEESAEAAAPVAAPAAGIAAPAAPRSSRVLRGVRAHALSAVLWVVSLSALLAFWYLGTRYKLDFYIRFTNIPSPSEVLQKLVEVNQSPKFMTNIGISLRRILIGFRIATLIGVPLGLL